jgi:hypothetical protein
MTIKESFIQGFGKQILVVVSFFVLGIGVCMLAQSLMSMSYSYLVTTPTAFLTKSLGASGTKPLAVYGVLGANILLWAYLFSSYVSQLSKFAGARRGWAASALTLAAFACWWPSVQAHFPSNPKAGVHNLFLLAFIGLTTALITCFKVNKSSQLVAHRSTKPKVTRVNYSDVLEEKIGSILRVSSRVEADRIASNCLLEYGFRASEMPVQESGSMSLLVDVLKKDGHGQDAEAISAHYLSLERQ